MYPTTTYFQNVTDFYDDSGALVAAFPDFLRDGDYYNFEAAEKSRSAFLLNMQLRGVDVVFDD